MKKPEVIYRMTVDQRSTLFFALGAAAAIFSERSKQGDARPVISGGAKRLAADLSELVVDLMFQDRAARSEGALIRSSGVSDPRPIEPYRKTGTKKSR
jgi:hypothetical protein